MPFHKHSLIFCEIFPLIPSFFTFFAPPRHPEPTNLTDRRGIQGRKPRIFKIRLRNRAALRAWIPRKPVKQAYLGMTYIPTRMI